MYVSKPPAFYIFITTLKEKMTNRPWVGHTYMGAPCRAQVMAWLQQDSVVSASPPHSLSWEFCTVTRKCFLTQWVASTDLLTLWYYSKDRSKAMELASDFFRHQGERSGKVVDLHLISTSIFSLQIKLLIFPHAFLFNERNGTLYLCRHANKTSQQGLLNYLTSWGVKQSDASMLVQSVSFAKVWLAVGIINMGGWRLQCTSPNTYPKMKAPFMNTKERSKEEKIMALKMHMRNATL